MEIKDIKYDDKKTWKKHKEPIYVVLERVNLETGISNGLEHWKFQNGEKCFNQTTHLFKNGDIEGNKLRTKYLGIFDTEEEMECCFELMLDLGYEKSKQFEHKNNNSKCVMISAEIPKELKDNLDTYVQTIGKTQKEVITLAIEQFLKNKEEILKQIKKLQSLLEE